MTTITTFKRHLRATVVPGDAVYLTSELPGQQRVSGPLMEKLAGLLDGTRSEQQIIDELADERDPQHVRNAIERMRAAGVAVDADPAIDPQRAGFYEHLGLDGDRAIDLLGGAEVEVLVRGEVAPEGVVQALRDAGIGGVRLSDHVSNADAFVVVLVDDYQRPDLAELSRELRLAGHRWLLAKPVGLSVLVGPIFGATADACYECLRARLAPKGLLQSYLRQRGVLDGAFMQPLTSIGVSEYLAAALIAQRVAMQLSEGFESPRWRAVEKQEPDAWTPTTILSVDSVTMSPEVHHLDRRPQCAECGDPSLQTDRLWSPVAVRAIPKTNDTDGGHRAQTPADFVAQYRTLVSPISGPVSTLVKQPMCVDGLHTYIAGQNFAIPMNNANDLRAGLRSASCGKGMSDIQAKASALGEAIERYSGVYHGDEAAIRAAEHDLDPARVINPNAIHLYSERQFADRDSWNSRTSHFHWVGDRLDPTQTIDWTPVWSLTDAVHKFVPTAALYYAYRTPADLTPFQPGANSNGAAAGTTLEDAILQGFFELVERDCVAMWWCNMIQRPRIDIDSFDEPYFVDWQRKYASVNRKSWVLDITNDLGVPTVVAVSYRVDKPMEDILFALGSHYDVKVAIGRALSEMNQFLPAVIGATPDGSGYSYDDPDQLRWWKTARLAEQRYLLPLDNEVRTADDFSYEPVGDFAQEIAHARRIVEAKGLEMLVLDQTRVDIGLPVAKVIVPGLRHFWPRYAPGRLYDVPVDLGWLSSAKQEDELNPIAMFL